MFAHYMYGIVMEKTALAFQCLIKTCSNMKRLASKEAKKAYLWPTLPMSPKAVAMATKSAWFLSGIKKGYFGGTISCQLSKY